MTVKNLIESKKLFELKREKRDAYISEVFGFTQDDLLKARQSLKVIDRIKLAAKILYDRLLSSGVPADVHTAQITSTTLTAIIDDGSFSKGRFKQLCTVVNRALQREYESRRRDDVPYIQFLREDLGIYKGNLHEAKRVWEKIEVSVGDWLKDLRLPPGMGEVEARLLGILLSKSNIHKDSTNGKVSGIELWGKKWDFDFFRGEVVRLLKRVNNLDVEVISGNQKANGNGFSYNVPAIIFSSQAMATWLVNHWKMPVDDGEVEIPMLDSEEQRYGLLRGILASRARPYIYDDRTRLQIQSGDQKFIASTKSLAERCGFTPELRMPKYSSPQYELDFSKGEVIEMIRLGLLIHPEHINQVQSLSGELVKSVEPSYKFSNDELRFMAFLNNCNVDPKNIAEYFDLDPKGVSHHLGNARRSGFKVSERSGRNYQPLDEVIKLYDKDVPEKRVVDQSTVNNSES